MKRTVAVIIIIILLMISLVTVNAEHILRDDHIHQWILFNIIDHGAYGNYYYIVNSCPYASYSHQHYRNRYMDEYIYVCAVCGEERSEYHYTVGWDEPEACTLHDWGKNR